jgi:hypothetical protein
LLGHAALLPAALRANGVEEFLADDEVTASDLRDLCLKMENPGLQEIRDSCADLSVPGMKRIIQRKPRAPSPKVSISTRMIFPTR